MPETIRVRIAVGMGDDGEYDVVGWPGASDDDLESSIGDHDIVKKSHITRIIELDMSLPESMPLEVIRVKVVE